MKTFVRVLTVTALGIAASTPAVTRAVGPPVIGPTVMMFHGAPLAKPVYITGTETDAFGNLHATSSVPAASLDGPYISVALFWGPPSDPAVNGTTRLEDLRPEMAWQHGRLYAATASRPAVLMTTLFTKRAQGVAPPNATSYSGGGPVPAAAVSVLQRHGLLPKLPAPLPPRR